MPLIVTVNTTAEWLRTDCNILGDNKKNDKSPILVAEQSKEWICGRSWAGIAGSNPARVYLFLVSAVCFQIEVYVSGWSLVQRSATEYGVLKECDREDTKGEAITRNRVEAPQKKKKIDFLVV